MDTKTLDQIILICPDAIIGVDRKGIINIFNKSAVKMLQYDREEVIGKKNIIDIYTSIDSAKLIKKMIYCSTYGDPGILEDYETELMSKSGKIIPILLSAILMVENGDEAGSLGFFHDITKRKEMELRLKELSLKDSLTGLYNQRFFYLKIKEELSRSYRYNRKLCLICFDFDNFKQINDTMGHLEGDKILLLAGETLKSILRDTDFPFRYGGDEFMILLTETGIHEAFMVAERIRNDFNKRWPYYSNINIIKRVTLSIGVTEAENIESYEVLINRADYAMYKAKKSGGNLTMIARPECFN